MHIKFTDLFQRMQEQLQHSHTAPDLSILIELVNRIRPTDENNSEEIHQKIHSLIQALLITPTAIEFTQAYLFRLINHYKQTSLFADSGILSLDGFWNQLSQFLCLSHY